MSRARLSIARNYLRAAMAALWRAGDVRLHTKAADLAGDVTEALRSPGAAAPPDKARIVKRGTRKSEGPRGGCL